MYRLSKSTCASQFTWQKVLIGLRKGPSRNKRFRHTLQICVFSGSVIGWWSKLRAAHPYPTQSWVPPGHDEKPSHTKIDMNWFMVAQLRYGHMWPNWPHWNLCKLAWFITVWNQASLHWFQLMGLIRYSCGHILGHHEPIPTKFGLWMFFIMLHGNMVSKTLKC